MRKVQSQLLVSKRTRDRADALALVRGEPRAEVYRVALEGGGLRQLERDDRAALDRLSAVAETFGMSVPDLVTRALEDGHKLEDLEGRKTYPKGPKA